MSRIDGGQALNARISQKKRSAIYLVVFGLKVSITLFITIVLIWSLSENSLYELLLDIKKILTSPLNETALSENDFSFPWQMFSLFLPKAIIGSLFIGTMITLLAVKKARSHLSNSLFGGDYREVSINELQRDFNDWWENIREKFSDITPKESFFSRNDLGAFSGEALLGKKFGAYFSISKDKVPIPEALQTSHIGVSGTTRTGKTTFITNILTQTRFYGQNALILDYNGELYKKFGRPEDKILCPFDKRTVNYSLFNEPVLPDKIAAGLVAHDINNPFFSDNGRKLLTSLMRLASTHEELHNLILMEQDPLRDLLIRKGIDTGKLFDNNETAGDVISTMQTNLGLLPYINHWNPRGRPFSLAKWAKYSLRGDVFIIVPDSMIEALKPWMRLFFEIAITGALERNPGHPNTPLWVIGDEIKQLGHLQSLEKAVTNGAKYNLRLMLGWQTDSQLEVEYGKETSSILGNIRTRGIFNPGNINKGVEDAIRLLGYTDVKELYITESHSDNGSSQTMTSQEKRKPVVSESKVKTLQELEYYLKLPHQRPVRLVAMPHNIPQCNEPTNLAVPPKLKMGGLKS